MATTLKEIIRRSLIGFPFSAGEGETLIAMKQAVNDALHTIAMVQDFDELITTDTTHAVTVADQKSYHIETDLLLVRPKDILSILLYTTDAQSRKLTYVPAREVDKKIPYPEGLGSQKPRWYTTSGLYLEFYPIPDDAYTLYIRHSQWPAELTNDTDEVPFSHLDSVIVFLTKDIANSYLNNQYLDFVQRAQQYLLMGVNEHKTKPDVELIAQPFNPTGSLSLSGEYWKNPQVRKV